MIAELRADVVGLQEVIRDDGGSVADQPEYLASKLSMSVVMGATRPHGGGSFGNAILSRLPVIGSAMHDLSHARYERRGCLRVDVAADGAIVHVFNCHFGRRLRERREQLALLADLLAVTDVQGPRVLVGDFNEWHRGPITRGLRRDFGPPGSRICRTFPSTFPVFALDRIYWDEDLEGAAFRAHRSRLARVASDHLPVVATLRLRPGRRERPPAPAKGPRSS